MTENIQHSLRWPLPNSASMNESAEVGSLSSIFVINNKMLRHSLTLPVCKVESQNVTSNTLEMRHNVPELVPPKSFADNSRVKVRGLTVLVGELMQILAQNNTDKLKNRLRQLSVLGESRAASRQLLLVQYQKALKESELACATAAVDKNSCESALALLDESAAKLEAAKDKLANLDPSDKEYAHAKKAYAAAELQHGIIKSSAEQARQKALVSAHIAFEKVKAADLCWEKMQKTVGIEPESLSAANKRHFTGLAAMTLLMNELSQLIGKNADSKLKANAELSQKLQEARQIEMLEKAKEQAKAIEKAERIGKVMGCVGKILGGLLTVVSIVGAVFTGGASLALAAVGIALMVADPIVKATTGKSLTDRIMAPILQHVIQPMMKMIADAINSALKKLGVKDDISNLVSTIVSAIVMVVMIIAITVAAKTAGKALFKKLMPMFRKVLTRVMTKVVPSVIKNGANKISKVVAKNFAKMGNSLGLDGGPASFRSFARGINHTAIAAESIKVSVDTSNATVTGLAIKEITKKESEIVVAMADIKAMSKYIKLAIDVFAADMKASQEAVEQMSAINLDRQKANLFILNPRQA